MSVLWRVIFTAAVLSAPCRGTADSELAILQSCRLTPPPQDPSNAYGQTREAAVLGQRLFFDPRISGNSSESCAICHVPAKGWGDAERTPSRFPKVRRNTQSILNAAYQKYFFWDGRSDSLWSQALAPIEGADEMNGHRIAASFLVVQDAELLRLYESAFGAFPARLSARARRGIETGGTQFLTKTFWENVYAGLDKPEQDEIKRVFVNLGKSLAAFERLIVSSESRFDRYVDELSSGALPGNSLKPSEIAGLRIFFGKGACVQCHSGPVFSNASFSDARVHYKWTDDSSSGRPDALIKLSHAEFSLNTSFNDSPTFRPTPEPSAQQYCFRTPALRDIALTAPYMHDGRFTDLSELLAQYRGPLGAIRLTELEVSDLKAFLFSLTSANLESNPRSGGLNLIGQRLDSLRGSPSPDPGPDGRTKSED